MRTRSRTPTRRALLGAGLAGGAAALVGCEREDDGRSAPSAGPAEPSTTAPPEIEPLDVSDWESVRRQFLLDPELGQFAAFVLSPHTLDLQAIIDAHREALNTDTEAALQAGFDAEDAVRRAAATYAGGTALQYALTDSTTMGLATMYGGLDLEPGDEVLSTVHDFFSTDDSLRLLARRTGATVERVRLYDDPASASVDEMTTRLMAGVTPRTRVVAVTWVHSSTGVRTPIRAFADALRGTDALLCVDGVHGFAAVDVDLPDLGCDALVSGTHKWLFGPRGTGIFWARSWQPFTEIVPTFSDRVGAHRMTAGGYHCFEHRWALADAFALQTSIGRDRVVARTTEQATRLKEGLSELGVPVVTPLDPELSAGIVCVDTPGNTPYDVVLQLRERGIVASATPYRTSYLRLGPSIATNPDFVERAITEVTALV